jgi:hypothetical protein
MHYLLVLMNLIVLIFIIVLTFIVLQISLIPQLKEGLWVLPSLEFRGR